MIKISADMAGFENKNYLAVEAEYRAKGFTNIQCINLCDLTIGLLTKPGRVVSITINGTEIHSGGKWFYPTSPVVITYHGFNR